MPPSTTCNPPRQLMTWPHHMQGKEHVRTPFGRIYEWLDMAEKFTFDDEEVTASGLAGLCIRCFPASRRCNNFE